MANIGVSRLTDGEAREKFAETPEQIAEAQRLARQWKPKTWAELKSQLD